MLVATIVPALIMSCGLAVRPEPYLPDCKLTPTPTLIAPATSSPRLASSRPFTGGVDDTRRPGFGGREWSGNGEVGGRAPDETNAATNPGPSAYGAYDNDDTMIHVRLSSGYTMTISPWQAIDPSEVSFDRLDVATRDWFREHGTTNKEVWTELEEGRQAWLRERGYTYSVRTFSGNGAADDQARVDVSDIKPVMTIDRPTDEPKFRKKMQVRSNQQPAQDRELAAIGREMVKGNARVSMPPLADHDAVKQSLARAEASKTNVTAKHQERGDEKASKVATR
ncbi:MAG: hypothetical protein K2Y21_12185 [Phycisphaerales bacterium]|nr:hypothetical protein [Phycisphaerales bacterium]